MWEKVNTKTGTDNKWFIASNLKNSYGFSICSSQGPVVVAVTPWCFHTVQCSGHNGVRLVGQQFLSFIDGINPRWFHKVQIGIFHQCLRSKWQKESDMKMCPFSSITHTDIHRKKHWGTKKSNSQVRRNQYWIFTGNSKKLQFESFWFPWEITVGRAWNSLWVLCILWPIAANLVVIMQENPTLEM